MNRRMHPIDLFESVQRDAELLTGSKLKMIQVLFESLCSALLVAQGHGSNQAMERKVLALSRAQRIIKGLQLTLKTDHQTLLSSDLTQLYGYMGERLWEAHVNQDPQAIGEVLLLARTLSAAWLNLSPPVMSQIDLRSTVSHTSLGGSAYLN